VNLDQVPAHHRRLLTDALQLGSRYGLALMGGYAVQAHGLVHRPSQDLEFATIHPAPMQEIITTLTGGLTARGWDITVIDIQPLKARFLAADPISGHACEVDVLKEALWRPPVVLDVGPVLALEDLIGTKVRALADRGLPRDFIDVHAARDLYTTADLENLGARHPDEFDLTELHDRLETLEWVSDTEFTAYGLTTKQITALRAWAQEWLDDLAQRLTEGTHADGDDDPYDL
jgi:hypothetical protein